MHETCREFARKLWRTPMLAAIGLLMLFADMALGAETAVTVAVSQRDEAFIIDAAFEVAVPLATAWEVLTDFDHMTAIIGNLTSSKVTSRQGNTWIVRQEGIARWGIFSFSFESERELRLMPKQRLQARALSGSLKRMESDLQIAVLEQGIKVSYHAETVPGSFLARMFGASFVRHEVAEQFRALAREMTRRHAASPQTPRPAGADPPE